MGFGLSTSAVSGSGAFVRRGKHQGALRVVMEQTFFLNKYINILKEMFNHFRTGCRDEEINLTPVVGYGMKLLERPRLARSHGMLPLVRLHVLSLHITLK